ncbi:MAG: two-component sensor histidine kinase [Sulfurimonas sp.]|jgi:two-component sensor histidine kinase
MLFIFLSYLHSSVIINNQQNIYNDFKMSYFSDITSKLTINEISKKKFSNSTNNSFTLGYKKGNLWFKIELENKSLNEEFILAMAESFYEEVELYYFNEKWHKQINGLHVKLKDREIKHHITSFNSMVESNRNQIFYLKVNSLFAKFGNIKIYKKEYFYQDEKLSIDTFYIFTFGVLFIIILFNIFLFISLKEIIYFYYIGYSTFYGLYLLNLTGFLVYFDASQYVYILQLSSTLLIMFLIFFSREYLEIKKHLPKVDKAFKYFGLSFAVITVLLYISYPTWNRLMNSMAALAFISLIIVSSVLYFKGDKKSKYYVFAIVLYFSFVVVYLLMIEGKIEYTSLSRYGYVFASVIESLIFSLMLANRYNEMQQTTIESKNKLIELTTKNQEYLKCEVENRTKEIQSVNLKLQLLLNERELLLKEVYHRVKNNFQVVISMLWFESKKSKEHEKEYLDFINRIKAMSSIHESLYNSKNLYEINIKEYLHPIILNIQSVYDEKLLEIEIQMVDIIVGFNDAISLGVIVNELLNNSIKHYKGNTKCKVEITFSNKKDENILILKDNGIGFESSKSKNGIGLKLIKEFSSKLLSSSYKFSFEKGTQFILVYKSKQ